MKKIFFCALCSICAWALTACDGSSYEEHYSQLSKTSLYYYADQQVDSVQFFTYDSWNLSTSDTWITASPSSCDVSSGNYAITPIAVSLTPNQTATNRSGYIVITSNYEKQQFSTVIYQYAWLNVKTPTGAITGSTDLEFKDWKKTFGASMKYNVTTYDVKFQTYADGATLTSDSEWAVPAETSFAKKGDYTVNVAMSTNESTSPRTATLTLTSNGVSTPITLTQQGKVEE